MQNTPFDIPDQMRQMADQSVEQAKKAFDQFLKASQDALAQAEGSVRSLGDGATDVNRQAMSYVQENISTSFEYAQRLVQARTIEEVGALQREYIARQTATLTDQGKQLGEMVKRSIGEPGGKGKK
jgi:phasin